MRERADVEDDPHSVGDRGDDGLRAPLGEPEDALADQVERDRLAARGLLARYPYVDGERVPRRERAGEHGSGELDLPPTLNTREVGANGHRSLRERVPAPGR